MIKLLGCLKQWTNYGRYNLCVITLSIVLTIFFFFIILYNKNVCSDWIKISLKALDCVITDP